MTYNAPDYFGDEPDPLRPDEWEEVDVEEPPVPCPNTPREPCWDDVPF